MDRADISRLTVGDALIVATPKPDNKAHEKHAQHPKPIDLVLWFVGFELVWSQIE
jgi:hypothetical protein